MGIKRHIVALGGGGFSMKSGNLLLDDFVRRLTGPKKSQVSFLPTARGDSEDQIARLR